MSCLGATIGDLYSAAWGERVVTNGGARPSQTTIDAAAVFYNAISTAGLLAKIKTLNIYAPDSLTAAITPLIPGLGSDPWTNSGFVAGDLTVDGLKGNGSKYLDTGVDPLTAFASDNVGGISYYHLGPVAGTEIECGSSNATGGNCILLWAQFAGTTYWQCYANAGGGVISYADPLFTGFLSGNRTAANNTKIYAANSVTVFAQKASGGGNLGNRPIVGTMVAHGYNNNGVKTASSTKRISFLCIHDGFTSAEAEDLYDAVQALRTALGGGFV